MVFLCDMCGRCCKNTETIVPELTGADGHCVHLNRETNLCKIYWDRPLPCKVIDWGKVVEYNMSEDRYYTQTMIMCELLKEFKI